MKFEHKGKTIELFLVSIHDQNYPKKVWEEAGAVWKTAINDEKYCGRDTDTREEVLEKWKKFVDWCIYDPNMKNI